MIPPFLSEKVYFYLRYPITEWRYREALHFQPLLKKIPFSSLLRAGSTHNLALQKDGTVKAWGSNECGQCGVSSDLKDVVMIAAGCSYSCLALQKDASEAAHPDEGYWGIGVLEQ